MLRIGDDSPIGRVSGIAPLAHFSDNTATGGIWRVGSDTGAAVLKLAIPNDEPATGWNHWRREPLAYRDGFVEEYLADSDLTAPRLLHAVTRDDAAIELWLEDVDGVPGEHWDLAELGRFATRLGALQAHWTHPTATPPWLSRRFLRHYTDVNQPVEAVDWDQPLAAAVWPPSLRTGLRRLWQRRAELLARAEALPSTVCHLDVWPKNLFERDGRTVLIDWAFVGHGAVGEDVGNLIPDTVLDGLFDVADLDEIHHTVTDAYLTGHRDGGGTVSESTLRQAIAITGAAKYTWLAPRMLTSLAAGRTPGSANYDPDSDTEEILNRRRPVFELIVAWANRALDA